MEKKITQRIVGILVVGSLVVIALPFFFGKNEAPEEVVANVTTTPKQDDATPATTPPVSTSDAASSTAQTSVDPATTTAQPPSSALTSATTQPASLDHSVSTAAPASVNSAPATTGSANTVSNEPATATPSAQNAPQASNVSDSTVNNNSLELTQQIINSAQNTPVEQPTKPQAIPVKTKKVSHLQKTKNLHKSAWVIQMGSFKNKDNAKRLTSKLRASGFKAFMHTVKSGKKERIRVFIGPEYKQASAAKLSNRVNQTIKMKGIVVSYKPLA